MAGFIFFVCLFILCCVYPPLFLIWIMLGCVAVMIEKEQQNYYTPTVPQRVPPPKQKQPTKKLGIRPSFGIKLDPQTRLRRVDQIIKEGQAESVFGISLEEVLAWREELVKEALVKEALVKPVFVEKFDDKEVKDR